MGKFIIIFYGEPTKSGFIPCSVLQYKGPDGEMILATYDNADEAKRIMRERFPNNTAQIVPILTNNGEEIYV